jgi:hypothetical protein
MAERWVGVSVSGDRVILVDACVDKAGPIVVLSDQSWKLQNGDRARAYAIMYQQATDYLRDNKVQKVVIKASALSLGSTKLAHLEAAELRGVVMAAAASCCEIQALAKAHISRTFGSRKVDEYVKDDKFWATEMAGESLRVGSREAAIVLLAARAAV